LIKYRQLHRHKGRDLINHLNNEEGVPCTSIGFRSRTENKKVGYKEATTTESYNLDW
jgi:hypothetical protein